MATKNGLTRIKGKSLNDYLKDDPSLMEKYSYKDFLAKKTAPDNTDSPIKEVYAKYKKIVSSFEEA